MEHCALFSSQIVSCPLHTSCSFEPLLYHSQILRQHGGSEAIIAALKKQVAELEQSLDDANKELAPCSALIDALKKQVDRFICINV